jgi:CRISPR-associated protein Cas1
VGWRIVVLENKGFVRCENRQLIVCQDDREAQVPLEDIDTVIVDSAHLSLSTPVLRGLSQAGALLIICDEKHLPCGHFLPQNQHYRAGAIVDLQLGAPKPLLKRLWQRLVIGKIQNQSLVLPSGETSAKTRLRALRAKVRSGDPANIEAQAARIYWTSLFGKAFRRGEEDTRNIALNFGYSLIRSALARAVTARGLLPVLGLFHRNTLNPFCLVDDLIEPFRPFVDEVIKVHISGTETFERAHRVKLIELLHRQITLDGEWMTISAATNECASSLVRAFREREPSLLLIPEYTPPQGGGD